MNQVNPLVQKCQAAGFDFNKLPAGASDIASNNDGTFTITVNGQPVKYSANGSVFSGPSGNAGGGNATVSQSSASSSSGTSASYSNFSGNYNIDPLAFAMASMGFDSATQTANNMPYGLGSIFGQPGVAASLQNYNGTMGFNFDFSQLEASMNGGTAASQVQGLVSTNPPVRGDVEITDESGNTTTVKKLAKEKGFGTTSNDGVYVKKDVEGNMKYYKYDKETEEFVECNRNGADITDEQRMLEEEQAKKEKEAEEKAKVKAKAREKASGVAGDMYSAMKGWGTDDSKLEGAIDKVSKDNVLEVLEVYQSSYSDKMDGETLIQSLQNDLSGVEEGAAITKIATALCERARELGLNEEAQELQSVIENEFKTKFSWTAVGRSMIEGGLQNIYHLVTAMKDAPDAAYADDDVVNAAIMKLANQIKAKEEGYEYTAPQPAAEEE